MPFTLVAFLESPAAATLASINGLADPHVRVEKKNIYIPDALPLLAGYYVLGDGITQARLESPSLRTLANLDVCPYDVGTEPLTSPKMHPLFRSPKALVGSEGLNLKATSATDPFRTIGLIWLADAAIAPVTGDIFTVRATATQLLVAETWVNGTISFDQTLPAGRYQVVGMRAKSDGLIAARLVFPGQAWRPGCIGNDDDADIMPAIFRRGALGVWGEFEHDTPPTVDFLSIGTEQAETVWLDLIKIA